MTAYEDLTSDPTPNSERRTPNSLFRRIEPLPGGRSRVHVERGALDHTDQFNLKSERQRLRFAQACDAKDPGCLAEILALLEAEACKQDFKYLADHDDGCRFVMTSADKLTCEPTDWLWERYIPAGAVTILEGDPGVGKSLLLADLAARTTRGFLAPDRNPAFDEPGHALDPCPELVWWFSGQDHAERTLAPRLRAAGADLAMIKIIEGTEDQKTNKCRAVQFPQDFASLWKTRAAAPRLVVIDPLTSFCGGAHNHQAAHKALVELARFASSTNAAVVVVRPLNRRVGAAASERGSAGPSLTAEARSALLLAAHPDDPTHAILAVVKSNLCARAPSLELSLEDRASRERERPESDQPTPATGDTSYSELATDNSQLDTPRISWHGASPLVADDLVAVRRTFAPPRSPFETKKVEEWLNEKLQSGPRLARELSDQATLDEIPASLLRRARISLNILPIGRNGHSTWQLPQFPSPQAEFPSPLVGEGLGVRGAPQQTTSAQPRVRRSAPPRVPARAAAEPSSQMGGTPKGRLRPAGRGAQSTTARTGPSGSLGRIPPRDSAIPRAEQKATIFREAKKDESPPPAAVSKPTPGRLRRSK
jgi:hypothetical protein